MASIRCTCIYRPSSRAERDAGAGALALTIRDPWCPAQDIHARAKPVAEPLTPGAQS